MGKNIDQDLGDGVNGLPKGTSPGGHEKDWLIAVFSKVVENNLTLPQSHLAVNPSEGDTLSSQMLVNEIQGPCPTGEYYARRSVSVIVGL